MPSKERRIRKKHEFIKKELPDDIVVEDNIVAESKEEVASDLEKKIDIELAQIYGNHDGTMPDMKHIEKKKRNRFLRALVFFLFACVFLVGVAWAGFFFFQPQERFSEADIILAVNGNEQVIAGEEVHFRINYRNAQNIPLTKMTLQTRYPEGFVFGSSTPATTNDKNDEWQLGALDEQSGGSIDIYGHLYGDLNEKQSLRVFLNYTPANFSAEFQKVGTFNVEINESPVELVVDGPDQISVGEEAEFTITLNNRIAMPVGNLALSLKPNENFILKSANPMSDPDDQYRWSLASLDDSQKFVIKGIFTSSSLDMEPISTLDFSVLMWSDKEKTVDGNLVVNGSKAVAVGQTEISASFVINGSMKDFSIQPGEMLHSSIVVRNTSATAIKNVSVRAVFDTPSANKKSLLNWTTLADDNNGKVAGEQRSDDLRRGIITWDTNSTSSLRRLEPNQAVVLDFSLPVKSVAETDLTDFITFVIDSSVEVQFDKDSEHQTLSTSPIKMVVNSDVSFAVEDKTSVVEGKNKHTITWLLNNSFHELKDISLETDLYGDIAWLGDELTIPAGRAEYNPENKKLIWTVDSMPTSLDVLALQFAVLINQENLSQTNLASKVKFKAKDVVTGEDIILVGDEILLNEGVITSTFAL